MTMNVNVAEDGRMQWYTGMGGKGMQSITSAPVCSNISLRRQRQTGDWSIPVLMAVDVVELQMEWKTGDVVVDKHKDVLVTGCSLTGCSVGGRQMFLDASYETFAVKVDGQWDRRKWMDRM